MNKNEWLKVAGYLGLLMMILATINAGNIAPYFVQGMFLIYVLLYAYGKAYSKVLIIAGSILLFVFRLFGYSSSYDLIDLTLWGAIFGLTI